MRGQKFQCDLAAKLQILSLVNVAHAPGAKLREDLVMTDGLPKQDEPILALRGLDAFT